MSQSICNPLIWLGFSNYCLYRFVNHTVVRGEIEKSGMADHICVHFYTRATHQVIVARHMCWFLKASNPPMSSPIIYFNFIPLGQMVSLFLPYMVRHTRLFNLTSYYCLPMFWITDSEQVTPGDSIKDVVRKLYSSVQHYSFTCSQWNGSKYFYVIQRNKLDTHLQSFKYCHLTLFYTALLIRLHIVKSFQV